MMRHSAPCHEAEPLCHEAQPLCHVFEVKDLKKQEEIAKMRHEIDELRQVFGRKSVNLHPKFLEKV